MSSEVQAIFLFAHVYVGFLKKKKNDLCFGIVWRILGLTCSQLDKHFRVLRWVNSWGNSNWYVAVYTWISLYIFDPCLIWRYLYRVKRWHWIIHYPSLHRVLHSMCGWCFYSWQTFNNNMLQSAVRFLKSLMEWMVCILKYFTCCGCICCFSFDPLLVSFSFYFKTTR